MPGNTGFAPNIREWRESVRPKSSEAGPSVASSGATSFSTTTTVPKASLISCPDSRLVIVATYFGESRIEKSISTVFEPRIVLRLGESSIKGEFVLTEHGHGSIVRFPPTERSTKEVKYLEPENGKIYYEPTEDPDKVCLLAHGPSCPTGEYSDYPVDSRITKWVMVSDPIESSKLPRWLRQGADLRNKH